MRSPEQRINIIIGQLEAVKKKLQQNNGDCFASVIQLKAIKSGVSSLMEKVLQEEFEACFDRSCSVSKNNLKKIFSELIKK